MNKTCSLCGVIILAENDMCETCALMMMEVEDPRPNNPVLPENTENLIETNQNYLPLPPKTIPVQFGQTVGESVNFATPMMAAADSAQPNQPFTPAFTPPPRHTPPPRPAPTAEKEYKPSLWYWISELPSFIKLIAIVLIFGVVFAFALKGFLKMDLSVISQNPDLEKQKPWFSAWFRSEPTTDEIFQKYEKSTFAQGKNLVAESYFISGQGEYVLQNVVKGDKELIKYKPQQSQAQTNDDKSSNTNTKPLLSKSPQQTVNTLPNESDFNVKFEISVKKPDKFLMKMTLKPKAGFNQSFSSFPTVGFNGKKGWAFVKTIINGNTEIAEAPAPTSNQFLKRSNNGVSMTFLRSSYSTVELKGIEDVMNRLCYSVKAVDSGGKEFNLFFDIETGLVTKVVENNVEMYILDYTNFDGTLFPAKLAYKANAKYWIILTVEQMKTDVPLNDGIFERYSYQ
jgi:hypothetical protein